MIPFPICSNQLRVMHLNNKILSIASLAIALFSQPSLQAQLPAPVLPAPGEIEEVETKRINSNSTRVNREGRVSFILRESFFKSLSSEQRIDEGPVRDFILGAEVFGVQRTVSGLSVDFLPSENSALFNFQLTGTTNNQTTSYTPQAAIQNRGRYDFVLNKRVQFNGEVVTTWAPSALLRVDQQNIGAATPLAPLPILGRIAERTAINVANQRLPEAQQIAAYKVTQQVVPEFNESIDSEISKVNRTHLPSLRDWLTQYEMNDLTFSTKTTNSEVIIRAATATFVEPQQQLQISHPASHGAMLVDDGFLHSLLQRLPLAGLRISDMQAEAFLENHKIDFTANETPKLFTLILDEQQPLEVFLRNGALEFEVRLSIQPVLGQTIGTHLFAFSLKAITERESIRLVPTLLQVRSLDETDAGGKLLSQEVLEEQISKELEPISIPRTIPLTFLNDYPGATLDVLDLEEASGDLKVEFQMNLSENNQQRRGI